MATKTLKMIYALKDGKLVHVSEVVSGLKCGCVCPGCGAALVARKGPKMRHHFAHHSGENCEYGYQTSLHLAAKDILAKARKMVIPPVFIETANGSLMVSKAKGINITKVVLEKKVSDIIPDVIVYSGENRFFVEIYVTHAIDEEKLEKIKKIGVSTIEINLSCLEEELTEDKLTEILLKDSRLKVWKYNKKAEPYFLELCKRAKVMNLVERRFALHADNCPIAARRWRGKAYANFIDDCIGCKYHLKDNKDGTFLCLGENKYLMDSITKHL